MWEPFFTPPPPLPICFIGRLQEGPAKDIPGRAKGWNKGGGYFASLAFPFSFCSCHCALSPIEVHTEPASPGLLKVGALKVALVKLKHWAFHSGLFAGLLGITVTYAYMESTNVILLAVCAAVTFSLVTIEAHIRLGLGGLLASVLIFAGAGVGIHLTTKEIGKMDRVLEFYKKADEKMGLHELGQKEADRIDVSECALCVSKH